MNSPSGASTESPSAWILLNLVAMVMVITMAIKMMTQEMESPFLYGRLLSLVAWAWPLSCAKWHRLCPHGASTQRGRSQRYESLVALTSVNKDGTASTSPSSSLATDHLLAGVSDVERRGSRALEFEPNPLDGADVQPVQPMELNYPVVTGPPRFDSLSNPDNNGRAGPNGRARVRAASFKWALCLRKHAGRC